MAANETVNIIIRAKNEATATLKGVESQLGSLTTGVLAAGAAYLTWEAGLRFVKAITAAAAEEEKQWTKVTTALRIRGMAIRGLLPDIQRLTDLLEDQSGVADELIADGFQRLIIAGYGVSRAYQTIRTALNVTAITGADLNSVIEALIKGAAGSTMQVNRLAASLGIAVKSGRSAAETLELINKQTDGAAQSKMSGYAKTQMDLAIAWERLAESLGKITLQSGSGLSRFLTFYLNKVTDIVKGLRGIYDMQGALDELNAKWSSHLLSAHEVQAGTGALNKVMEDGAAVFRENAIAVSTLNRELDSLSDLPPIDMGDIYGMGSEDDEDLSRLRFRQMVQNWQDVRRAADESARAQQRAMEELAGQYRQVLDPLHDWILAGRSISDTFSDMGDRIKSIFVDQIIASISQAIAKLVIFNGLAGSSGGIGGGGHLLGGILPFGLGNLLPFDNRNNDSMLQREVMWMGQLITRGITAGMQREIPLGQPAAVQSGGATTIHLHFNGPVTSDEFVKDSIIPAIERSASRGHSRIQLRNSKAMGGRYGFGY